MPYHSAAGNSMRANRPAPPTKGVFEPAAARATTLSQTLSRSSRSELPFWITFSCLQDLFPNALPAAEKSSTTSMQFSARRAERT